MIFGLVNTFCHVLAGALQDARDFKFVSNVFTIWALITVLVYAGVIIIGAKLIPGYWETNNSKNKSKNIQEIEKKDLDRLELKTNKVDY